MISLKHIPELKLTRPYTGCVYALTNITNNRVYIGSTTRNRDRIRRHFTHLRGGYHYNKQIQKDYNKVGEENFRIDILKIISVDDYRHNLKRLLLNTERDLIKLLLPFYNTIHKKNHA